MDLVPTIFGQNLTRSTQTSPSEADLHTTFSLHCEGWSFGKIFLNLVILLGPPSFCDGENVILSKSDVTHPMAKLTKLLGTIYIYIIGTLKFKFRLIFHGHLAE